MKRFLIGMVLLSLVNQINCAKKEGANGVKGITLLDLGDVDTHYATFQCHNQKVVAHLGSYRLILIK